MRVSPRFQPAAALIVVLTAGSPTGAQPPSADPALRSPGVDQVLFEQQRRERRNDGYSPAQGGMSTASAPSLPDGTPFSRLAGRLTYSADGATAFTPLDAEGKPGPTLALLPGSARMRAGRLLSASADAAVLLTGQYYGYRNESLLLLTSITRNDTPGDAPPATVPPADPNPSARDVAGRLEAGRTSPRALDPRADVGAERATGPSESRLREGEILTGRAGRLVTAADGEPALAFDNDPDSPAWPALPIVRCRMRERVEAVLAGRAEGPRVRMSGRLLVDNDRAYLMPTYFQVLPEGDLAPRQ